MGFNRAIVTIAVGKRFNRMVNKICRENWELYAAKYGYELIVIDELLDNSERGRSRCAAWQKCLILSQKWSDKYERIVWIDTDILINPNAPDICDGIAEDKIGAVNEFTSPTRESYNLALSRMYEHWTNLKYNPVINYGAKEYYKSFGIDCDFEEGFWGYPEHHEDIKTLSLFKCQISNSTAMINANLFKNYDLKYMEGFFLAEDYELWVRALENIKAYNIQKPLVGICVHDESICHKKHNILKSRTYDVYKKLLYKLGINPTEEELNLHSALGEYAVLISINNYLERTEKWLFKLIEANKIHKIYNSKNFNSMIDKLWFEACNQYIKDNSGCWNNYINPLFKNDLKYDTSHKRKIFYRSISKYFKSILKK